MKQHGQIYATCMLHPTQMPEQNRQGWHSVQDGFLTPENFDRAVTILDSQAGLLLQSITIIHSIARLGQCRCLIAPFLDIVHNS